MTALIYVQAPAVIPASPYAVKNDDLYPKCYKSLPAPHCIEYLYNLWARRGYLVEALLAELRSR
jgi:hypothetical protein